jgi:hypothetical protein
MVLKIPGPRLKSDEDDDGGDDDDWSAMPWLKHHLRIKTLVGSCY